MTEPLKTVEDLIHLTKTATEKLQEGQNLDDIDIIAIFDQIHQALSQQDKTLPELQSLKNVLDLLTIELEKYEVDIIKDLGQHRARATAHKAYLSSAKR